MSKKNEPAEKKEPKEQETPEVEAKQEPKPETTPELSETEKAAEELKAERDKYLRLAAEYDNFRKRSRAERENIYADVRVDTVTRFLPVYDNLTRALAQQTADEAYRKGVEMTLTQLRDILGKLGVTEIEAQGKTFDPAVHNAVMHIEDEKYGEGEIVMELQKGFKLGDKVIRFSMVQVAN